MIPKIFHQIWLGPAPLHPMMLRWQAAWKKLHPGWTLKLWRGGKSNTLVCGGEHLTAHFPDLLARACHYAQLANIWRYEVVLAQGGIYLDTDMEPLKNIESTIAPFDAFGMCMYFEPGRYSNALIGATPGHAWLEDMVDTLPSKDPKVHLSMGDRYLTEMAKQHLEVHIFPKEVVISAYTKDRNDPARLAIKPGPETCAVHHFSGQWYPTAYLWRGKAKGAT
jgi:mannosyltransferase OCH1-like enzyme